MYMVIGGKNMNDLFEKIINHAISYKTSDIHFLLKQQCIISFRQNGRLTQYDVLDYNVGIKLINYIRFKSNIDINYQLMPQTGHINYTYENKIYYLRVSSLPGKDIDSIVVRILNNHRNLSLDELTVFKDVKDFLNQIVKLNAGLFIVSGATGSGKSTTLYTLLDTINKFEQKNIVTLEDPIEIKKSYCLQIQINDKLGITYNNSLKQILRHDPDVIMIGEIRDEQTARLAITCALTGYLVLTTIHSSNCLTTIRRLLNLGILKIDVEDVLIGVMAQKILYQKSSHEPIILVEYLNRTMIKHFFKEGYVKYTTFKDNAKYLLDNDLVDQKQLTGVLYE